MKSAGLTALLLLSSIAAGQRLEATFEFDGPAFEFECLNSIAVNPQQGELYLADEETESLLVADARTGAVLAWIPCAEYALSLFYSAQANELLCFYWGRTHVQVFDCVTRQLVDSIHIGGSPRGVCYDSLDDKLYCFTDSGTVTVIDCRADTLVARIALSVYGDSRNVCYVPTLNRIYCSADNGESLKVMDCALDSVVASIPTDKPLLRPCWVGSTGRIYFSCPGDTWLRDFDPATNTVRDSIAGPGGGFAMWNPMNDKVYAARGMSLYVGDPHTTAFYRRFLEGSGDVVLLFANPVRNVVYALWGCTCGVGEGFVLDGVTDSVVAMLPSSGCINTCYSSTTNTLYCSFGAVNFVTGIDCRADTVALVMASECYGAGVGVNEPQGKVYYFQSWPPHTYVIDVASRTYTRQMHSTNTPYTGVANADGTKLFTVGDGEAMLVFSGTTDSVLSVVPMGRRAWKLVCDTANDRVYAAGYRSLVVVDAERDSLLRVIELSERVRDIVLNGEDRLLYVLGATSLFTFDCRTDSLVSSHGFSSGPRSACWDSCNRRLYVLAHSANRVYAFAPTGDSIIASVQVAARPFSLAYDPRDNRLFCACEADGGTIDVIDCASLQVVEQITDLDLDGGIRYCPGGNMLAAYYGDGVTFVACEDYELLSDMPLDGWLVDIAGADNLGKVAIAVDEEPRLYVVDVRRVLQSGVLPTPSGPLRQRPIVGDRLVLHDRHRCELVDATGRKVGNLLPGSNDVSGVPPGVYFIRRGEGMVTRKVVIAR